MKREALWVHPYLRPRLGVGLAALLGAMFFLVAATVFMVSFLWPSTALGDPNARLIVGQVSDFEVHEPVFFQGGKFWLVKQPDDSFIALYARDPHRGCTVPWRPNFSFVDPRDGVNKQGWFRNPCHGETYDINGLRVFGPSPRSLDQYPVYVDGKSVIVRASGRYLVQGVATP